MQSSEYAVVIPTNRPFATISSLLNCLVQQTLLPREVIVVYDQHCSKKEADDYHRQLRQSLQEVSDRVRLVVVSTDTFSAFQSGKGASYVRNFGIRQVSTPLLCCVDDDNEFEKNFMERMVKYLKQQQNKGSKNGNVNIICPTEEYHWTGRVRSRGYVGFNHWIGRAIGCERKNNINNKQQGIRRIMFCSSNCLFGYTKAFRAVPFDEEIPFVYEDFMMTRTVSNIVYFGLGCVCNIRIHHMMRDKTKIQDLYMHSSFYAYQKSRNRIIFVRETSTWSQQIVYFLSGLRIHTFYLIVQLIKAQHSDIDGSKWSIFVALIRGIKDGIWWTTKNKRHNEAL